VIEIGTNEAWFKPAVAVVASVDLQRGGYSERNLKSPTVATLFLICDALDVRAADIVRRLDTARKGKPGL
jgi:hypothetical protein